MENQREKNMENEMEPGVTWGLDRDPSIQIPPTLGPEGLSIPYCLDPKTPNPRPYTLNLIPPNPTA